MHGTRLKDNSGTIDQVDGDEKEGFAMSGPLQLLICAEFITTIMNSCILDRSHDQFKKRAGVYFSLVWEALTTDTRRVILSLSKFIVALIENTAVYDSGDEFGADQQLQWAGHCKPHFLVAVNLINGSRVVL